MSGWREYLERVAAALFEGEPVGVLPKEPPPPPARFYWRLLRALSGDMAALEAALKEAKGYARANRFLAQEVAHRVRPEVYPPPEEELRRAWEAFRFGEAVVKSFLAATKERTPVELFTLLLPPAESLPLAAGEAGHSVPVHFLAWEGTGKLRFGDLEAEPFEMVVELPKEAFAGFKEQPLMAWVLYRGSSGEPVEVIADRVEIFPEEGFVVLVFPWFWLYDVEGRPQTEDVILEIRIDKSKKSKK